MLPVFGGISGRTRTTLNIYSSYSAASLSSSHLQSVEGEEQIKEEITLQFARDEFFQLHHICGELPNSFARFLVGHRVVVQHPAELPLDWLVRFRQLFHQFRTNRQAIASCQLQNLSNVPKTRAHHFGRDIKLLIIRINFRN